MELATQALGSLLPKLGTLLSDEYKLQKGVRGEIQFLQAEMESMQAVLNMLSKLPAHQITELDKIWVRNLKELSYDIEDSVDIFMVRIDTPVSAKPHSFKRFFDKIIGLLTKAKIRHHVANDIDDIKRRIREVADRRERYKFEGVAAHPDTATVDPRVLASFEHAAKLVGTDVPVEKISDLLTKRVDVRKQKNRMVVSIVGVGGLGKTTIANLVYERLRGQFDCGAFVSVSLRPNMNRTLSIISLSAQENFAIISEGPNLISPAGKIRRLSLQGNKVYSNAGDSMEEKTTANVSHVRTLFAFGDVFQLRPPLSKFSVLRVLVLLFSNNIKGIGSLPHLRYLELFGNDFGTEVLDEIGNLKHLEILDLSGTRITELPANILKLEQLECLITDGEVRFPDGIGNLVSLQQLEFLDADESPHTLAELGNLTGLRMLSVKQLTESYEKTFLQSLSTLHNLRILKVTEGKCSLDCIPDQWSSPARLQHVDVHLSRLPRWFSSLSELSSLSIWVHILRQDDIKLLGALPMLRGLYVYIRDSTEERLVIGTDQPFRALTYFKFEHHQRCWLVFTRGVMPKLQRLELLFEAQKRAGGGFDVGLENLISLKLVNVEVECWGARIIEVEDAEAKCRDMIHMHPNHPTLELTRY